MHYVIMVAGVTHNNHDGTSRQAILESMRQDPELRYLSFDHHQRLILNPEPDNPYDEYAIQVLREDGVQLGYVPASDAIEISAAIRANCVVEARLLNVVGGDVERPTFGARVLIGHAAPGFDRNELLAYLDAMLGQFVEMG